MVIVSKEIVVPYSFELALVKGKLDDLGTYVMCDNHREFNRNLCRNEYPFVRFDPRSELWDKLPDGVSPDLEDKVLDYFYDEFHDCYGSPYSEEYNGVKMCFDINGYRLLALVPAVHLWYQRQDKEEEWEYAESAEEKEEIEEEIANIDKELVECAFKIDRFKEISEAITHWFDDYVVVFSGSVEEPEFDFVHIDWYHDMKEEKGWKLWEEHKAIEEYKEEAIEEIERETLTELLPRHSRKMLKEIVVNTMMY